MPLSPRDRHAACIAAVALQPALTAGLIGQIAPAWAMIGAALVLSAGTLVRPADRPMLLGCAAGMTLGFLLDWPTLLFAGGLAGLCRPEGPGLPGLGLPALALRHLTAMPWMDALMVLGGLTALSFAKTGMRGRLGITLLRTATMLAGSAACAALAAHLPWSAQPGAMIAAMTVGMVLGMAAPPPMRRPRARPPLARIRT